MRYFEPSNSLSAMSKLSEWLLKPITIQPPVPHKEIFLSAGAALVAIALLAVISSWFAGMSSVPFMVASMGASAALMFGAPHSPLAQPWAFVGGHLVSALVGITCHQFIADSFIAACLAVGGATFGMLLLRCLHPPGGATALMPVVGGPEMQALGYGFLVAPLGINLLILLAAALLINNMLPGRRFPIWMPAPQAGGSRASRRGRPVALSEDDLRKAMEDMGAFIDVTAHDLNAIYGKASLHALERRMGEIQIGDIMTPDVVSARYGSEMEEVWNLMRAEGLKGVPVVDPADRVIGIVTIVDFLKQVDARSPGHIFARLAAAIRRTPDDYASKPEAVGQIMSTHVVTAREGDHILSLVPLFAEHDIHHIPVVDDERRLTGIVTQSDLMAALYQFQFGDTVRLARKGKRRTKSR